MKNIFGDRIQFLDTKENPYGKFFNSHDYKGVYLKKILKEIYDERDKYCLSWNRGKIKKLNII